MDSSNKAKPKLKVKDSCSDASLLSRMDTLSRRQWEYLEEKYITRTQKCVPDKFAEMCHMHLAFLLDLSDNKLEQLLDEPGQEGQGHSKRRLQALGSAVDFFKKKEKPTSGLFGAPLTDEGVCLMLPLIKFLKSEKRVCQEGLFRKPGNRSRMNTLREALTVHGTAARLDPDVYSPCDVAGVLKEFLRELPEPLLTDKHMEAHRQIQELGRHAQTEEASERSTRKKLSALQLLTLLMPGPARRMTMQVLGLLQRVADCMDSRMTPATLGTIFAPIFFLNRKVDASEMCSAVSQAEPSLAFMIENAHLLCKAPAELVVDLANYWNCLETGSPLLSEVSSNTGGIKKSISGRTLNTNICYLDREASRCEDIASHTQAELESLFAHVQSLPDTPHNLRIKRQLLKATTTPTSGAASPSVGGKQRHSRSRSIGASIRKRLPSLGRSRGKQDVSTLSDFSSSSSSSTRSNAGFKSERPSMSDLLKSPAASLALKNTRESRPRQKRLHKSVDDLSGCTPPKQELRELTCPGAGKTSIAAPAEPAASTSQVDSVQAEDAASYKRPVTGPSPDKGAESLSSQLENVGTEDAALCKKSATPSSENGPSASSSTTTSSNHTEVTLTSSAASGAVKDFTSCHNTVSSKPSLDNTEPAGPPKFEDCSTENMIAPPTPGSPNENTKPPVSPNENIEPVASNDNSKPLEQKSSESVRNRPGTPLSLVQRQTQIPLTPNRRVLQQTENEISYLQLPQHSATKASGQWRQERHRPGRKAALTRPRKAPGTPVMPRPVLRLAHCDALETSI